MANEIFISANDARQNPIREHIIHTEGRIIENAILDAVQYGLYSTTVSDGTPMTQSTIVSNIVSNVDPYYNTFEIINHSFATGDTVQVTSTKLLPDPLTTTATYYVIYIDINHIKLATSLPNALGRRPISVIMGQAVNYITLTNPGEGYLMAPSVTISGGNATVLATALAQLATYGSIYSIGVLGTGGSGYTYIPDVSIEPQGSGAAAGTVSLGLVGAVPATGGTSYRVGDTLGISGGTGTSSTVIITQIDTNGAVLAVGLAASGSYTALPTLTGAATTSYSGYGTGCTLNLTMGVVSVAISSGGENYIAAPIIIFNGGSGTGATAIALVNLGSVYQINMTNAGSGYTSFPTLTFINGENATATAILQPTSIANVDVLYSGGNTYTSSPNVTIESIGSGATAGQVSMSITWAKIGYPGQGYLVGDTISPTGGVGTNVAILLVNQVGPAGQIVGYSLINSGIYTQLPILDEVSVTGGSGVGATLHLTASVYGIAVAESGSDYVSPPVVIISDSTGFGATAIANINNTEVISFTMTNLGMQYKDIPNVTVTNGDSVVVTPYLIESNVALFLVGNGGSGYTTANTSVVVTGTISNLNATGNVIISNGAIIDVTLTNDGGSYVGTPNVVINGDGVNAVVSALLTPTELDYIAVTNVGANFNTVPNVNISGNAIAIASLTPTGIQSINVTFGGDTYTGMPNVIITPSEQQVSNANVIAPGTVVTIGYALGSISITDGGAGYQTVPTVSISAPQDPNGNAATATANIGVTNGTISVISYPSSLDYFAVWKGYTVTDNMIIRPYTNRMDTIINYFVNYGYKITRQTNPLTGNTLSWFIQW